MGLEALRTIDQPRRLTLISSNETPLLEANDFKKPEFRVIKPGERRLSLVPAPEKSNLISLFPQDLPKGSKRFTPLIKEKIVPEPVMLPVRRTDKRFGKGYFSASAEIMVFIPFELINKAYSRVRSRQTEVKFKVKFWCTPCQRGHIDRMDWSLHSKRLSLGNTRTPDNIIQLDSKKKENRSTELKKAA